MSAKPLHEVFEYRAEGVGHLLRSYIANFNGWSSREPLSPILLDRRGVTSLWFHRRSVQRGDADVQIGFDNITPKDVDSVHFGSETIINTETDRAVCAGL